METFEPGVSGHHLVFHHDEPPQLCATPGSSQDDDNWETYIENENDDDDDDDDDDHDFCLLSDEEDVNNGLNESLANLTIETVSDASLTESESDSLIDGACDEGGDRSTILHKKNSFQELIFE